MDKPTTLADIAAAGKEFQRVLNAFNGPERLSLDFDVINITAIGDGEKRLVYTISIVAESRTRVLP